MKKMIALGCVLFTMTGCLSVVRLCRIGGDGCYVWSEERQERVWHAYANKSSDPFQQFGLFPSVKMRWYMLKVACHWAPPDKKWEQHLGIPCALVGLTPGLLVDIPVDVLSLPWDWKYRNNEITETWIRELDEERACRSLCVSCGKTSDGRFARCKRRENDRTAGWNRYYGVCPDCVSNVKTNGYYFEER